MIHFKLSDPYFLPHAGCEIEFDLVPGLCLVIVGENGIGKTTLSRRLLSELQPHGPSYVEQVPLQHFYDRKLGAFKNLFLRSCSDFIRKDFFEELWSLFGLLEKENRSLSQLSGGENQALKLILGLCGKHDLIILDEPFHYLDQARKEKLKSTIIKLLQEKKTFIVIEHDLRCLPEGLPVIELHDVHGMITKGKEWTT